MTDSLVSRFRKMYEDNPELSLGTAFHYEKSSKELRRALGVCIIEDYEMERLYNQCEPLTEEHWAKLERVEALYNSPLWRALK